MRHEYAQEVGLVPDCGVASTTKSGPVAPPILEDMLNHFYETNARLSEALNRIGAFRHRVYAAPEREKEQNTDKEPGAERLADRFGQALNVYSRLANDARKLADDCERIA